MHDRNNKFKSVMTVVDLAALARDPAAHIRQQVAIHENISTETLKTLALDLSLDVRLGVACDHSTPIETLLVLMTDNDPRVTRCAEA